MSAKAPVMRVLGSIAAVVLLASSDAQAADALMPMKTPLFIAAYSWSGLYIGGHVGAGFSYRNWTLSDGSLAEAGDAAMLGGQIGFNYQVGKWVIGVEGDAAWGNLKDEGVCPDGINTCWTRQSWLATATGRIGYAFDPALFLSEGWCGFYAR